MCFLYKRSDREGLLKVANSVSVECALRPRHRCSTNSTQLGAPSENGWLNVKRNFKIENWFLYFFWHILLNRDTILLWIWSKKVKKTFLIVARLRMSKCPHFPKMSSVCQLQICSGPQQVQAAHTHSAGGGPWHNTHLQSGCILGYDSEGVIYCCSQGRSGDTPSLECITHW